MLSLIDTTLYVPGATMRSWSDNGSISMLGVFEIYPIDCLITTVSVKDGRIAVCVPYKRQVRDVVLYRQWESKSHLTVQLAPQLVGVGAPNIVDVFPSRVMELVDIYSAACQSVSVFYTFECGDVA